MEKLLRKVSFKSRKPRRTSVAFEENIDNIAEDARQEYVMGEGACQVTVLDVADLVQQRFGLVTGGRTSEGHTVLSFPDLGGKTPELSDSAFNNFISYLCSVPLAKDVEKGFAVVLDRRKHKWHAVRTMLTRFKTYFPGELHSVFILRPSGFFQNALSNVGFKWNKEDFKFQVIFCSSLEELYKRIPREQLTAEFGGTLSFDEKEWTEQRAALEKFSSNALALSRSFGEISKRLEESELPNDVATTELLMRRSEKEKQEIETDLTSALRHGVTILRCIRDFREEEDLQRSSVMLLPWQQTHAQMVERLLAHLELTQRGFREFWEQHELRLQHCLQLRRFEDAFRQLQFRLNASLQQLRDFPDVRRVASAVKIEELSSDLDTLQDTAQPDMEAARRLKEEGEEIIAENQYAADCVRPKCVELGAIGEEWESGLTRQRHLLAIAADLFSRIDKANRWCTRGVELLAGQLEAVGSEGDAQTVLLEIEGVLSDGRFGLEDPSAFRAQFSCLLTEDIKLVLQQVLARVEDVRRMLVRRAETYTRHAARANRPVQSVQPVCEDPPTPGGSDTQSDTRSVASASEEISLQGLDTVTPLKKAQPFDEDNGRKGSTDGIKRKMSGFKQSFKKLSRSRNKLTGGSRKAVDVSCDEVVPSAIVTNPDQIEQMLLTKQRLVMRELIDTERMYVDELGSILEGYAEELDSLDLSDLVPDVLAGQRDVLFGNLDDIYRFHNNCFLKELEDYEDSPSQVGACFLARREEFQLYSEYCLNQPRSEVLRQEIGENCDFFRACQERLGHKLPLAAYLLKPIQRITKYQLLLKEMLKYCGADPATVALRGAIAAMVDVCLDANNTLHQVAIHGYPGDLLEHGRLLKQGPFVVWSQAKKDLLHRFKPMNRHLFLYEKAVLLCKRREEASPGDAEKHNFSYKGHLKMCHVGLTETVKSDKKKLELWLHGRSQVYTIQSSTVEVKEEWVGAIKAVLMLQLATMKAMDAKVEQENLMKRFKEAASLDDAGSSLGTEEEEEGSWGDEDKSFSEAKEVSQEQLFRPSTDDLTSQQYVAISAFTPEREGDLPLAVGDVMDLLHIASDGWWEVQLVRSGVTGWAPADHLDVYGGDHEGAMSALSSGFTLASIAEDHV